MSFNLVVSHKVILNKLSEQFGPWDVSGFAQRIGIQALSDRERRMKRATNEESAWS